MQQLHCLHCHHPPSRPPVHPLDPSQPANARSTSHHPLTLRPRAAWLQSIPGIGPAAAATLLADVPELGACSRQLLVLGNARCRTQTTWDPPMP